MFVLDAVEVAVGVCVGSGGVAVVVWVGVMAAARIRVGTAVGGAVVWVQAVSKTAVRQNQRNQDLSGLLRPDRSMRLKSPGKSIGVRCRW